MDKQLPARPNLAHLRGQAKTLLAQLAEGTPAALRAFLEHLPAARGLTPAALRKAKLKLADAQSVVARQCGFASWAALARHVEQLRSLEGTWQIARLEIEGRPMPAVETRILIDGDRFRTESPEATYEGRFTIDAEAKPPHFDIHFVEGPNAGEWSRGLYRLDGDDALTLCLGLEHAARPSGFVTRAGSGHALEQLRRVSVARPANVSGGTPPPEPVLAREEEAAFDGPITPLVQRLQGEWAAVELVRDGKALPESWLGQSARTMKGNEVKVVVSGQTMVHATVRVDERATPIAVDYFNLSGKQKGTVTRGIMEWLGDDVRFFMAPAGAARPADFTPAKGMLSRWRRR